MARVLGVDAVFADLGVVVVEAPPREGEAWRVVYAEHVETKKGSRKRGVRVADDDAERIAVILRRFHAVVTEWGPVGLVAELPPGSSKGARAAHALGIAKGIVVAVGERYGLPSEWVTPLEVKRAAGWNPPRVVKALKGKKGKKAKAEKARAGKVAVQRFVRGAFAWAPEFDGLVGNEHVADAAGAVCAAMNGTLMRSLRAARIAQERTFSPSGSPGGPGMIK